MPHVPIFDLGWFFFLLVVATGFFYLGRRIERRKRLNQSRIVYVLAAKAKVVPFTAEDFDKLAQPYRASSGQCDELVASLFDDPALLD